MRSRTAPLRNRRDIRIEHESNVAQQKQSTEMTAIDEIASDGQRNRRDAAECVSNYNADRNLLIGCSQPNIIEVKPQCNQEDEGMVDRIHPKNCLDFTNFVLIHHFSIQLSRIVD